MKKRSYDMEKILVVDDSVVQAALLKSILDSEYEVMIAHTAEEGLVCARSEDLSLILLDVVMPGMDGFMLLRRLQEEIITRSIPVILITSLPTIEDEQRGFKLGAVDYIAKPFHPMIVEARVSTHVKLYRYRKQVEQQSMTDQLTGLANRWRYENYSFVKWEEGIRLQLPFSVCMFDIDYFKKYNDTFGHPAGDKVLAAVADLLSSNLRRATDFVARYGGEEFIAIIFGYKATEVFEHVKQIRHNFEHMRIPHDPSVAEYVTVSIGGVTVVPQKGDKYHMYLKIADDMLYEAKHHGRNQVVWFGDDGKQWRE